jgi:hypothetical protein
VLAASVECVGDAVVTHRGGAWHCHRRHGILEHSGRSGIQAAGLGAAATTRLGFAFARPRGALAVAGLKRLGVILTWGMRLHRTSEAARRHGPAEGGEGRAEGAEGVYHG